MTIKQQGGIFGRNPTYNDLSVEGTFSVPNDSISGDAINGGTATVNVLGVGTTTLLNEPLVVKADNSTANAIRIIDRDANSVAGISWVDTSGVQNCSINNTGSNLRLITGTDERLRIKSDGNIDVKTGNIIISTSGKGIDFSATGDITGVTSELLDSYEEGEFDVTLTPTTSGTITLGSSYNKGRYTFVGRLLTVTGFVIVDSVSSPVGNVRLSLPIAIGDGTEASGRIGGSVLYYNGSSDVVVGYNGVETNSYVQLFTNAASVASGHAVHFSITYMF